jgi:cysteinyl-tRNA synthetase
MQNLRNNHEFRDQAGEIENGLKNFRELKDQVLALANNRVVAVDYRETIIFQIKLLHRDQNNTATLQEFVKAVEESSKELRYMKEDLEEIIETFRIMMNFDDEEAIFELNEEEIGVEL